MEKGREGGHVTDHVITEVAGGDRNWVLRNSWVKRWRSNESKPLKRKRLFRIALCLSRTQWLHGAHKDSPASKSPLISSQGFTYHSRRERNTRSVLTPYYVEGTRSEIPIRGRLNPTVQIPSVTASSHSVPHAPQAGEYTSSGGA
jgi:hypothetical protein